MPDRRFREDTLRLVDNGLGVTMLPEMALNAGILDHTDVVARPLDAPHPERRIALVWRSGTPREKEFRLLAEALKKAETGGVASGSA